MKTVKQASGKPYLYDSLGVARRKAKILDGTVETFDAETVERPIFADGCSICGKEMHYGDRAYGTTTGSLEEDMAGFSPDDVEPWLTVACEDCGQKISNAINDLVEIETKKRLNAQFEAQRKEV